jgi:hypothetical protein
MGDKVSAMTKLIWSSFFVVFSDSSFVAVFAEIMLSLGYEREDIMKSLEMQLFDEVWAAYHLLGIKSLTAPVVSKHQYLCIKLAVCDIVRVVINN